MRSRELWGESKREDLLESLNAPDFDAQYETAHPAKENRFGLRPRNIAASYSVWAALPELCESVPLNGLMEKRGGALMALEKSKLQARMEAYFDPKNSLEDVGKLHRGLAAPAARFDPQLARKNASEREGFKAEHLLRYAIRPFDLRWCYFTGVRPLWNEPRPALRAQLWDGNLFLVSRFKPSKSVEGAPMWFASTLFDDHALSPDALAFPFQLQREVAEQEADSHGEMKAKTEVIDGKVHVVTRTETFANLSLAARSYLAELGFGSPDTDAKSAALLWHHALAIGYSSAYRAEHAGGLAADWPRVPLPLEASTLDTSAALGTQVAEMLDMARPAFGIDASFRKELEPFGMLCGLGGTPEDGDEALQLNENWGFFGERGIVQPGTPRLVTRAPNADEIQALEELGLPLDTPMLDLPLCRDKEQKSVISWWSGVPKPVWDTVIGGYPVLKKWLSYRDERVLGRALHLSEAQEVENIVRRLVVLWSLGEKLDANHQECAANCRPLVQIEAVAE